MIYLIEVPMPGQDVMFEVCRCDRAEHVTAVILALLSAAYPPSQVRVTVLHP